MNGTHFAVNGNCQVNGLVNGVDIVRLNQTVVKFGESRQISGVKTFLAPVTIRGSIFANGAISGIRIPQDVILLNSTELISGLTTFTKFVMCTKNLLVRGRIDGVNLEEFFLQRVTLTGNERISSPLNFTDHVSFDNLIVKKTINGIPINAFVTRSGNHVISGQKEFAGELFVFGNLISSGLINGINLTDIQRRTVSLLGPQAIPGSTEFRGYVSVKDLSIDSLLNGVDISRMAEYFDRYAHEIQHSLGIIKTQLAQHETMLQSLFLLHLFQASSISYFELLQELPHIGERFVIDSWYTVPTLFGEYPTQTILLWNLLADRSARCRQYSTASFNVADDGRLIYQSVLQAKESRYFPIVQDPVRNGSRSSFLLWTNTTSCNEDAAEGTLMLTMNADSVLDLNVRRSLRELQVFQVAPYLRDAKMFTDKGQTYLVLANKYDRRQKSYRANSVVYRFDYTRSRWFRHQEIETYGANTLDIASFVRGNQHFIFLAIGNAFNLNSNDLPSIIMRWDSSERKFKPHTAIRTATPSAVLFVQHSYDDLFVVFANEKSKLHEDDCGFDIHGHYTQPVNLYHFNGNNFAYTQSIDIPGVVSLETFKVSDETYLVAASRHLGKTFVLQLRGYNLFDTVLSFSTPGNLTNNANLLFI